MGTRKVACFAGAVSLLAGLAVGLAEAQQRLHNVVVRGEGVCGTAGPVGRYTLKWTVINPEVNGETTITSATESGAYEGEVDIEPNPLPAGESGTASDGPVPGSTEGPVTLKVDYVTAGGVKGQSTGRLYLEGNCVSSGDMDDGSELEQPRSR